MDTVAWQTVLPSQQKQQQRMSSAHSLLNLHCWEDFPSNSRVQDVVLSNWWCHVTSTHVNKLKLNIQTLWKWTQTFSNFSNFPHFCLTCRALYRGWWCSGRWKVRAWCWFGFGTTSLRCYGSGSVLLPGSAGGGPGSSRPRSRDIQGSWRRLELLERLVSLKLQVKTFTNSSTLILNNTTD